MYTWWEKERKRKRERKKRIRIDTFVPGDEFYSFSNHVCGSLVRYLSKHAANFLHSLILRLWHFLIYEDGEEQLQRGKNDENVSTHRLLQRQETDTDDKVGGPVHSDGDGGSGWPGRLIEQFGHEEPWDTSRPGGEQNDEHNNENDRQVRCHLRRFLKDERG